MEEQLPVWLQLVLSAIMFAVSGLIWLLGHLKKNPISRDVIIPPIHIADRQTIERLAESIDAMNLAAKEMHECTRDICHEFRGIQDVLDRIEQNQKVFLRRDRDARGRDRNDGT